MDKNTNAILAILAAEQAAAAEHNQTAIFTIRYTGDYSSNQLFARVVGLDAEREVLARARATAKAWQNKKLADSFHFSAC